MNVVHAFQVGIRGEKVDTDQTGGGILSTHATGATAFVATISKAAPFS